MVCSTRAVQQRTRVERKSPTDGTETSIFGMLIILQFLSNVNTILGKHNNHATCIYQSGIFIHDMNYKHKLILVNLG